MVFHISKTIFSRLHSPFSHNEFSKFSSRKIRLDGDSDALKLNEKRTMSSDLSFISRLNDELNHLPAEIFSIERIGTQCRFDEDYSKRNGVLLRCKLIAENYPLVSPLNLRISINYPDEEPEILSLTKSTPPKLESTGKQKEND